MKKKKTTLLPLNKKSISKLQNTAISGGNAENFGYLTSIGYCKTRCCSSKYYQDCTVTYEACITEPRFCGMF
ncbi:hypothetical protein [Kordia jejudonensis]|uniref:hypothetical protein n=1 Tax=Kordia jejudonensis TaxID=1348245 RepID=UPI0006295FF5|nr:hypothetical protein [Kordia jejudonensis]